MACQAWVSAHILGLLLLAACGCSELNSPAEAQNPGEPPLALLSQWGVKGDGPGQLDDPQGMAADRIGNVYVADAGSQFVHKFAADGTPLLSFQEDSLKEPQSIAVDYGGTIYVTDPSRAAVFVVFPMEERDRHRVLRLRTRPSAENSLSVAVDDDDMVYVFDASIRKVFIFSSRLSLKHAWIAAPAGTPKKPADDIGPLVLGGDGNLYIADVAAGRLLRFSTEGRLLANIAPASAQADPRISEQFAVSRNYIFVMDMNGSTLHVWNMDGSPKLDIDLSDRLGQGHRLPPLLAVSPRRDLFVLDTSARRVFRYHINF
ncbi:MAG TPA: NHL repeat-containing protein [Candidatus Cybelea sp.]|nr:NHL repeat-containing protein [Candidatus Cybelea sp.]